MNFIASTELVPKSAWSSFTSATKTVCSGIKDAALWCGRVIKVIFTDYIIPAMKKIWPFIQKCLIYIWEFMKTPAGIGTTCCFAGIGVGLALLAFANLDSIEDEANFIARVMLRVFAGFSFAIAGASLAVGIALGMG